MATTPGTQPNLLINVITPVMAITVRFVRMYLTTFLGLMTFYGVGGDKIFGVPDMVSMIKLAAWASLSTSGLDLIKNVITVFGRLEGKYPLSTGSI